MRKPSKFTFTQVSRATTMALCLASSAPLQAGPGFGDSRDIGLAPLLVPSYFANSPAGARAWVDAGGQPAPTTGAPADYAGNSQAAYSATVQGLYPNGYPGTGQAMRKFVDPLPLIGELNARPMADGVTSKYLPEAVAAKWINPQGATTTDDYLELAVVEFADKLHSDLRKPSVLRGYVQIDHEASNGRTPLPGSKSVALTYPDGSPIYIQGTDSNGKLTGSTVQAMAVDAPHHLGPVIRAVRGVPTRIKFINLLPVGRAETELDANGQLTVKLDASGRPLRHGDLFLPVDTTLPGAGLGPDGMHSYTQNRANLHLHGGDNPWISDGGPHGWITPAGEADAAIAGSVAADVTLDSTLLGNFLRGASAVNVPDMNDPGPGAMTYYFPNGQSARMLWLHDQTAAAAHVNVYAGMALPYLLSDNIEQDLVSRGVLPGANATLTLMLQDKTFVPDDIALQDARWNTSAWGQPGDLWFPHVYEALEDINQSTGFNATGRWAWGPLFWPIFPARYELPSGAYGEASLTPEAWLDTPLVNGVAYPTVTVEPRPYRLRVLNASNDRTMTFNLFVADDAVVMPGAGKTEVKKVPITTWSHPCDPGVTRSVATTSTDPTTGLTSTSWCTPETWSSDATVHPRGVPDWSAQGPTLYQIASDGGLLPGLAPKDATPVTYLLDKGRAVVGNADLANSGLHLANGERADLVVDFSAYAGKTLIVYNDAGNPEPGADPRNDYYTGFGDLSSTGGAEDTRPGYGPNTQTMMQIVVAPAASSAVKPLDTAALEAEIRAAYVASQDTPVVAQAAYNGAFGTTWNDSKAFGSIFTGSLKEPVFNFVPGDTTPAVFNSILVSNKGKGYVRPPAVALSGGNGTGASATASLKIDRLHVIDGGSGYKIAPVVTITSLGAGSGAGATSTLKVGAVQVTTAGSSYSQGQVQGVALSSGGVYTPGVSSIALNNAAANRYRTGTPTVTISGGGGSGATAVAVMTGNGGQRRIASITVTNGGSGYTTTPTVTISAPVGAGGVRATATAATASVAPTVTFPTPVGGSPAAATVQFNTATGQVTGLTLTSGGRGYTSAPVPAFVGGTVSTAATATTTVAALPTVTFPAPLGKVLAADGVTRVAGVTATGVAQVSATGGITGVTVTNPGSGYTVAPTPVVSGVTGTGARLASTGRVFELMLDVPDPTNLDTAGGGGYSDLSTAASEPNNPTPGLVISIGVPPAGGAQPTAGATGKVFDISLTNAGKGYTGSPTVTITAPAANAVLSAAPTYPVASYVAAAASTDTAAGVRQGSILVKAKAIQELFEPTFGRYNYTFGIELPYTNATTQTTIPLGSVDTPTELISDGETQIWKITHNGLFMHPLHFHLGTVQVINRVGWDNFVTPPELNELGWKETVKVNPLEDLIVAVRPRKPATGGFGLPNSVRLLDPTQSEGALTGFTQIDVNTGLPTPVANVIQDFGWEYSWHTQVLSRVANDMARPVVFNANEAGPAAATGLGGVVSGTDVVLNWTDVSTTEFQYRVERSDPGLNVWLPLATILANATTYTDSTAGANAFYDYRVVAIGQAGETTSNVASVMPVPTAPGNLQAARAGAPVSLSWTDASFETSYLVQRSVAGGNSWNAGVTLNAGNTSYTDSTALANTAYDYRVTAINAAGQTVSNTASVAATQVAALPGAPTGLTVTKLGNTGFLNLQANIRVSWTAPTSGGAVTSYTVQRCVGANCTNFGNQSTSATSPYQQTVVRGLTYRYRVLAVNAAGSTVSTTVVNIAP